MQAIVLYGPGEAHLAEFQDPVVQPDYVKVAVSYCGICGSDFHKYEGKKNTHPIHYPVPLGHEISGVVVEVGSDVKDFKPGDRVTVDPNWSCGHCSFCQKGLPHFCKSARGVVKGMAQYVASPQENVYHLPDHLDMKTAALAEPVSCCVHGLDMLGIRPGDKCAIVGYGAIGAIMLQMMLRAGAGEVIVVESNPGRREHALKMGASRFVDAMDAEAVAALGEAGDIDRVMECVGIPAAQQTSLEIAGKGATVVLFGVSAEDAVLPFSGYMAFSKELTIKSSFVNPHTMPRAIGILASGAIQADEVISTVLDMADVETELNERKWSRMGKVLVRVHGETAE